VIGDWRDRKKWSKLVLVHIDLLLRIVYVFIVSGEYESSPVTQRFSTKRHLIKVICNRLSLELRGTSFCCPAQDTSLASSA